MVLNHKSPDDKKMNHLAFVSFFLLESKTIPPGPPSDVLPDLHCISKLHCRWPVYQQGREKRSLLEINQYHPTCIDNLITKPFTCSPNCSVV